MRIRHNDKIFVAGHNGLVGSSICRILKEKGFKDAVIVAFKDGERISLSKAISQQH